MKTIGVLTSGGDAPGMNAAVEVMGHGAGDIALQCGLAVGVTAIIVPEIGFNLQSVIDKILETQKNGRNHFIIVVSEGLCDATQLVCSFRQIIEYTRHISLELTDFVKNYQVPAISRAST